jgi:hypothetical protein
VQKVPLLDLTAQFASLRDEIMAAVAEVCESQYFILGKQVSDFEQQVAEYSGVAHGIGVSSGTDEPAPIAPPARVCGGRSHTRDEGPKELDEKLNRSFYRGGSSAGAADRLGV